MTDSSEDSDNVRYVSVKEIAAFLQCDPKTVRNRVKAGVFPPGTRFGSHVRWRLDLVLDYAKNRDSMLRQKLVASSAADPSQLSDDDLADLLPELAARHLSNVEGSSVSAADVAVARLATDEEQHTYSEATQEKVGQAAEQSLHAALDSVARAHPIEALLMQAAFFPSLRAGNRKTLANASIVTESMNDQTWRMIGLKIAAHIHEHGPAPTMMNAEGVMRRLEDADVMGKRVVHFEADTKTAAKAAGIVDAAE